MIELVCWLGLMIFGGAVVLVASVFAVAVLVALLRSRPWAWLLLAGVAAVVSVAVFG